MINLIWGLINLGLFMFFLIVCFRITSAVREKMGLFAAVIFVLFLLSFAGGPNPGNQNINPQTHSYNQWEFTSGDSVKYNATSRLDVSLEKTFISRCNLDIAYYRDDAGHINIPVSASSSISGWVMGTNWNPSFINVTKTYDANKFEYVVQGTIEWKLCGLTIYSQLKAYKGIAWVTQADY